MVDIISNSKSSGEKKFLLGLFRFLAQSMIYYEIMMHYVLYARAITSAALPCVWITKRERTSKSKDNNFNSGLLLFCWRVIARTRK
jgi:hypothetical protein